MRKLTPAVFGVVTAATLAIAGAAYAAPGDGGRHSGPTTRAEAQAKADQMFARMDVNGDGVLSPEDRTAMEQKRFTALDTNKDGMLSLAEFSAGPGKMRGPGGPGGPDGPGGPGDGHKGHGKHFGHKGPGGMGMMKMADTNNDGKISKAEFEAASLARFDKVDTNGDGTISQDERQAAKAKWQEARKDMRAQRQAQKAAQ